MVGKRRFWDASVRPAARYESLVVLLAAAALLCSERYIVAALFRHTRNLGWQTPQWSQALEANHKIQEIFPRRLSGTIVMAIEAPSNGTALSADVRAFAQNVSQQVSLDERVRQFLPRVLSYWSDFGELPRSVVSNLDFVSPDRRMTWLLLQPTNIPDNHNFGQANDFLQEFCSSPPPGYNLHITGMPAIATGSGCSSNSHAVVNPQDMSFKCLFYAEVVTTPIALLIMGCLVRHWRLLILPLFSVVLSFGLSAAMLIPWMDHVEVPADGIAAMGSVILALSLDYSLFLLSRFSENHNDKLTLQENVDIIKACTCRTIAVSGVLVAIAFFSGILLPERNLQGTCICLGFAVLACVATNVVFLPAVFVVFGPMLVGNSFLPTWWGDVELAADLADEEERSQRPEADNANWLVIMRVVERAPVAAIALVVLFVWPILSSAPSLHITADRFAMMPLWSPAVLALRNIQDAHFPTGLMSPYEILVTAPDQPDDLVISNEIRSSLEPLGRPELKDLVEKMGLGDLRNALKEGLAGTTTERPGGWPGFVELMRGVTCAQNHTESTPQHPHCSCCPNAFLDCRECDFMDKCESPEMQAALKQFSSGNVSLDEEHLRMLKDCALRAQALDFKASHLKTVGDQLMSSPLEGANLTAPVLDKTILERFPFLVEVVHQVQSLSHKDRGMLLLPSGFAALLELCEDLYRTGGVASMLGPSWLYHRRLDWVFAVGLAVKPELRDGYNLFLQQFAEGKHALLQVHTKFPSIGAMSADWAQEARRVLRAWQHRHPAFQVQLAGGNAEAADTRDEILRAMWTYLIVCVSLIMMVLYLSFQSLLVPLRLALALVFTLLATFGMGVVIYQTTFLHGLFPQLKYFSGITYEVIPLVTGIAIALGLDYDIFLVSRIVEFRMQRYSDRASIFRGVLKTGDVISGAGLIMSLAFTGLVFSDKIFFQQFGVLIITSVLLDTFVVRTVLVPALMLIAQKWNWWPRTMPTAIHDVLEGEVESCGGLSRPILAETALDQIWGMR